MSASVKVPHLLLWIFSGNDTCVTGSCPATSSIRQDQYSGPMGCGASQNGDVDDSKESSSKTECDQALQSSGTSQEIIQELEVTSAHDQSDDDEVDGDDLYERMFQHHSSNTENQTTFNSARTISGSKWTTSTHHGSVELDNNHFGLTDLDAGVSALHHWLALFDSSQDAKNNTTDMFNRDAAYVSGSSQSVTSSKRSSLKYVVPVEMKGNTTHNRSKTKTSSGSKAMQENHHSKDSLYHSASRDSLSFQSMSSLLNCGSVSDSDDSWLDSVIQEDDSPSVHSLSLAPAYQCYPRLNSAYPESWTNQHKNEGNSNSRYSNATFICSTQPSDVSKTLEKQVPDRANRPKAAATMRRKTTMLTHIIGMDS